MAGGCLLLPLLLLTACFLWSSARVVNGLLDYQRAEARRDSAIRNLPLPPGAVIVKRVNFTDVGTMRECESLAAHVLVGTDALSYPEILEFYRRMLPAMGWGLRLSNDRGLDSAMDDDVLSVTEGYDASMVGRDTVQDAKTRFRTLYLVTAFIRVFLPVPPQCIGG
jgi:hypothetical protein